MNTPLESLRSAVRLRCARVTAMVAVAGRRSDRSLDLCASCRHPVSPHHASLTFSFFSSNNGAFRSVDAGGPTQICLVLHEEAKTILIGGAGVGAVSFGEERGAQNIWWWPAALLARAGPSGTSESVVFCVGLADDPRESNAGRICRQLCSLASCSTARIERSVEARRHAVLRYHGYHLPPY